MSYTALYRKFRPSSFVDVIGQDHIVKTLTNQIKYNRIAHAYLFCGTRGTGKTSTAKIFAKAVNCLEPLDGNPCNRCAICSAINNHQSMNIIEIDAASNNGVDNIREIREEVKYSPTEGAYKVYIIDEVHMLSTGAFNALLKTLEEPPSHVIFILATTEPHKIPATILSRCQRYDFKRISIETISNQLLLFVQKEGVEAEVRAIRYIAKVADGSMRDALSILDQCIAFYLGEEITLEKVLEVLGAVDTSIFIEIINALHDKDAKKSLEIIDRITVLGREITQFLLDTMQYLRSMLIVKSIEHADEMLEISKEHLKSLKDQASKMSDDEITYYIKALSRLESTIKYSTNKRVIVEVEFIKICQPSIDQSNEGLIERISDLEKRIENKSFVDVAAVTTEKAPPQEVKEKKKKILVDAIPEDIKKAIASFRGVIDSFEAIEKAALKKVVPAMIDDGVLYIICETEVQKNLLAKKETYDKIVEELETLNQRKFNTTILTKDEYDVKVGKDDRNSEDELSIYEQIKGMINFPIEEISR